MSIRSGNLEGEDLKNVIHTEQINNDDPERNPEPIFEDGMIPHAGQAIRSNCQCLKNDTKKNKIHPKLDKIEISMLISSKT